MVKNIVAKNIVARRNIVADEILSPDGTATFVPCPTRKSHVLVYPRNATRLTDQVAERGDCVCRTNGFGCGYRIAERIVSNELEYRGFRVSDLNKEGTSACLIVRAASIKPKSLRWFALKLLRNIAVSNTNIHTPMVRIRNPASCGVRSTTFRPG